MAELLSHPTGSPLIAEHPDWDCGQWIRHIQNLYHADETALARELAARLPPHLLKHASKDAALLICELRDSPEKLSLFDEFMQEYSLDNEEGLTLMVMAEALLRIPDTATRDAFIRAEMSLADWEKHIDHSTSAWVNAATRGLSVGSRIARLKSNVMQLLTRPGQPLVRQALKQAMQLMGNQFVLGENIEQAVIRANKSARPMTSYSFDMLGEAAVTESDAERYLRAYRRALDEIDRYHDPERPANSLSIKLSALHPRYEENRRLHVIEELGERLNTLISAARERDIPVTIDAEEADRLELSLALFEKAFRGAAQGWGGLGLAVQAYSKRATGVLAWVHQLATSEGTAIPVRLVKGAYWDTEIKRAQQKGQQTYPVFTRKAHTDLSYLVCAQIMLQSDWIRPQFATHNAQTISTVIKLADAVGRDDGYEFQRLQGMGEALYRACQTQRPVPLRIYAPVGEHQDLLPYLVRRLLENGANSSFVHHLWDENVAAHVLTKSPLISAQEKAFSMNPATPLPADILAPRKNSSGINLSIPQERDALIHSMSPFLHRRWQARPQVSIASITPLQADQTCVSPCSIRQEIGSVQWLNPDDAGAVISAAQAAFERWRIRPPAETVPLRRRWLEALADLLEAHRPELIALCALEAGKTLQDGVDEVREAVDFCRYYSAQTKEGFETPLPLPGPTGEANSYLYEGRGVWFCISPWNFPIAIFLGQISAAIAAGNTVIAKPAEPTSLIAARVVELAWEAGIPRDVLQCVPGRGPVLGEAFLNDRRIAGVAFTGSEHAARQIAITLAHRGGPLIPLIAETGGQNAMIADSSALPEQLVQDAIRSAFTSAGQRCSALRVLCLQEDIADKVISLLKGAMHEVQTGNPLDISTDLGPVISDRAQHRLQAHLRWLQNHGTLIARATPASQEGTFVTPVIYSIDSIADLKEEHFGPVMHVVRYKASQLGRLIEEINETGYGLTLSIHSRNPQTIDFIWRHARVGNVYVNRDQIGAVVGVQPFGGMGKSGSGPKAGGPDYVRRFAVERTLTVNTTASGGNADLLRKASQDNKG